MVKSLLSEADAREVEAAVAQVETQTAAEVVVAVLPQSQDYWQGRVLLSAGWALAAGLAFLHFQPWRAPVWALALELGVGAGVFLLSGLPALQRRLIGRELAQRAVQARAFQLFAERGLRDTRGRTALLIFVSELERRVVLLGDRALDSRLGQQAWDDYVKLLVAELRAGQARAGLLRVLELLTPHLAALAPRQSGDQNELPDAVLRG
jgi:putative membrane protein